MYDVTRWVIIVDRQYYCQWEVKTGFVIRLGVASVHHFQSLEEVLRMMYLMMERPADYSWADFLAKVRCEPRFDQRANTSDEYDDIPF